MTVEREVQGFWDQLDQFKPGIECAGVEPLGTERDYPGGHRALPAV